MTSSTTLVELLMKDLSEQDSQKKLNRTVNSCTTGFCFFNRDLTKTKKNDGICRHFYELLEDKI